VRVVLSLPHSPLSPLTPPSLPGRTDTSMSNKYVGTGAAMALALGILVARFGSGPDYSYEGQQTLSYFVNLFSAAQ